MTEEEIITKSWESVLIERIRNPDVRRAALKYVERLVAAGVPPIFDFAQLSELVGVNRVVLAGFLENAEASYRSFRIPKQSGGFREISSPAPTLLMIQKWIKENILDQVPVHSAAHGFVKGRSVVTFAQPHVNKAALLHIDVRDFFPSISLRTVYVMFRNIGYAPNVSLFLSKLCCAAGRLPQGASTSPSISNIIFSRIDARLNGLACNSNLGYTRYADNIVLSGNYISLSLVDVISSILRDQSFEINNNKTYLSTRNGKRIIAGVSVAGEKLSLPRDTKRALRQQVFGLLKYGFFAHTAHVGELDPIYVERLVGRLLFWQYVEPSNRYVAAAIESIRSMQTALDMAIPS